MRRALRREPCFLVSYNTLAKVRGGKRIVPHSASIRDPHALLFGFLRARPDRVSTASHGRGILYTAQISCQAFWKTRGGDA